MTAYLKKNKKKLFIEFLIFIFFTGIFVLFAHKTYLLYCGYFFADDHEIVRINETIHSHGFLKAMGMWMEADIHLRLRPVYWIFRITESFAFGNNIFFWHLTKALELGFCSYLMYFFARKMKMSYFVSILFSLVTFLGEQCAIVFRLGPQEPLALIWLFFSLIFCIFYSEKNTKFNFWCLLFSLLLMMLTKESFLILVPAVLLFLFYMDWKNIGEWNKKSFFGPFVKYKGLLITSLSLFFIFLAVIVFYCGTDSTGYAGFSSDDSIKGSINSVLYIWKNNLSSYLILFAISFCFSFLSLLLSLKKNGENRKKGVFLFVCEVCFVLFFIFTQSMLHAKSGMTERYLLPCISGIFIYTFIFVSGRLSFLNKAALFYNFVLSAVFVVLLVNSDIYKKTKDYSLECIYNMQMLDSVAKMTDDYLGVQTPVVVSTRHGEWNMAICAFLQELYGIDHVYALSESSKDDMAEDRYLSKEEKDKFLSIEKACIYVAQSEYLPLRLAEKNIIDDNTEKKVIGYYIIYHKK